MSLSMNQRRRRIILAANKKSPEEEQKLLREVKKNIWNWLGYTTPRVRKGKLTLTFGSEQETKEVASSLKKLYGSIRIISVGLLVTALGLLCCNGCS